MTTSGGTRHSGRSVVRTQLILAVLTVEAVLGTIAFTSSTDVVPTSVWVIAPLLIALVAGPWTTAAVGVLSVALAILSVGTVEIDGSGVARLIVVVIGATLATIGSAGRRRLELDIERLELLAAVGEVTASAPGFDEAARRLLGIVVPELADGGSISVVPAGGRAQVVARTGVSEGAGVRTVVIALTLGPRTLGTLTLSRRGLRPRFTGGELRLLDVIAGRAALALENARLLDDLARAERELAGILSSLAEAVTVQGPDGRIVYANEAAATLLGAASVADVISTEPEQMVGRFEARHPDGRPVETSELPARRILAGEAEPPPLLTRSIERETGRERWTLTKATAILGSDGRPALAVNIIEDVTEATRSAQRSRLLAEAAEVLSATQDPQETIARFADLLADRLADWCAIDLPGEDGTVEPAAVAHREEAKAEVARTLRDRFPVPMDEPTGLAAVLRGAPTFVREDITDADLEAYAKDPAQLELLREVGFAHVIVVPMRAGAEAVGALTLVRSQADRRFSADEIDLAEELGRRAATTVLGARLIAARLAVSETLQRSLLPRALPEVEGLRFAAHYRAAGRATEVGGDFYDAFELEDGVLVVIGDVTGKGAPAAALTALARAALESVGTYTGSAADALGHLNEVLLRRPDLALCSVACVHLRPADPDGTGVQAEVRCAGHPAPILLRDGVPTPVGEPGSLLGAFPDAVWPSTTVELRPGDVLLLRTDGVTDVVGPGGDRLGEERLLAGLEGLPSGKPAAVVARVRSLIADYGVGEQRDDTAAVAIGVEGDLATVPTSIPPLDVPLHLDGRPESVAQARRAIERVLTGNVSDQVLVDVRLLVSELASNAVKHAGGEPYELLVEFAEGGGVRVEVTDNGTGFQFAERPPAEELRNGGYGLALVEKLAARWGLERNRGTRIWFER